MENEKQAHYHRKLVELFADETDPKIKVAGEKTAEFYAGVLDTLDDDGEVITEKKQIKDYLETLPLQELGFVSLKMIQKKYGLNSVTSEDSCCVGDPPQGLPPTPNGDWECDPSSCKWVWVPET